jgi:large subunit ribosomal protein L22
MKATLKYNGASPQKARLVADMIRGRQVEEARNILLTCNRAVARDVTKLLMSALANATNNVPEGTEPPDPDHLFVERIFVDQAPAFKRIRPRAMGRAFRVTKRNCHISIELGERENKG